MSIIFLATLVVIILGLGIFIDIFINKKKNNHLPIKICICIVVVVILIFVILKIFHTSDNSVENLDYTVNYCINTKEKYLSQFNVIEKNRVKVNIKHYNNLTEDAPDTLKDFVEKVCDIQKYGDENQIDYSYKCGYGLDLEEYTYIGTLEDVKKQFEDEESYCYTLDKDEETQKIIENKKWCNYYSYKYFITFDNDIATRKQGSFINKYNYSTNGNKIILYDNFSKYEYTYNEEKNIIEEKILGDYFFECENEEEDYNLVRELYNYDGKTDRLAPNRFNNKYKFNHVECSNGITATYDEDRKMLFPSENKSSECIIYFDNIQN
ncbi:MAG: hypothetical protein ACI4XM_00135 [Candidatus Coprovivens sp.]